MRHLVRLCFLCVLLSPGPAWAAELGAGVEAHRGLLDIVKWEMIWSIIVFALFFAVLSIFIWPKILGALKAREQKIHEDLAKSEQAARRAQATLKEYQASLAKAHEEARKIIEHSRAQSEQLAEKIQHETRTEITAARQRAEVEIRLAKEQAITDIYSQVATLATGVAGRILQRELKSEDQKALVERSLAEFNPTPDN
jgi:F-type H+-transporting ATPase subunit b